MASEQNNNRKILVTGAAGFIGYHLSKALLERGYRVLGLDNINDYYTTDLKYARLNNLGIDSTKAAPFNSLVISSVYPGFSFIRTSLEDRATLQQLFEDQSFDTVIHLAAQAGVRYSLEHPESYIDSNIVGFLHILECCRHQHAGHLIYASSSSVYGGNTKIPFSEEDRVDTPISLYAATKKANELMAYSYSHLYKIPSTGLRFFTVYGPWGRPDMAPDLFATAILKGNPLKVFNKGNMSRDFTFITDVIDGILFALAHPPKGNKKVPAEVYNLGHGAPVDLMVFISTLEKEFGARVKKEFLPMQAGDVQRTWADISRLEKQGYQPKVDIAEGVKIFAAWFKEYYNNLI